MAKELAFDVVVKEHGSGSVSFVISLNGEEIGPMGWEHCGDIMQQGTIRTWLNLHLKPFLLKNKDLLTQETPESDLAQRV